MRCRRRISFFVVAVLLLHTRLSHAAPNAGSPRIVSTPSALTRLRNVLLDTSAQVTPALSFLQLLPQSIPVFRAKVNAATDDFKNAGGYSYCSKTISSMGLLSLLGNREAGEIAKLSLLRAAEPFTRPLSGLGSESNADVANTALPYARRIRTYNLLRAKGESVDLPSRGDPIYLETGMMASCLAIGLDWLSPTMTSAERTIAETAAKEVLVWSNNIDSSFFSLGSPPQQRDSNWNAVMNGGSGLLALASTSSTEGLRCNKILSSPRSPSDRQNATLDENARERVCQAIVGLRFFKNAFTDSGGYPEGPTYWLYGMQQISLFLSTLERGFGRTDLDSTLSDVLARSGEMMLTLLNQDDDFWESELSAVSRIGVYSFADSPRAIVPSAWPFQFLALKASNQRFANFAWSALNQQATNEIVHSPKLWAEHSADWSRIFTLFFPPSGTPYLPPFQRTTSFSSSDHQFDIVALRARGMGPVWTLLQKGGSVQQPHAHLDSGSFVLRIGNADWFSDLGAELLPSGAYPPGYFSLPTPPRYTLGLRYFRKNDLSHNLVTLASRPMNPEGSAALLKIEQGTNPSDGAPFGRAIWDTSTLYSPEMSRASRSMTLTDRGRYTSLDVLDALQLAGSNSPSQSEAVAVWRALTCLPNSPEANITTDIPQQVRIRHSANESLHLSVIQPEKASIRVLPADPNSVPSLKKTAANENESSNASCSLIEITATGADIQQTADGRQLVFLIRLTRPF